MEMFEPLLPLWKHNSIDGMMIGTVDKIYLEFDEPFWPLEWKGCSILWRLEDLKEVRADPNGDWLEGSITLLPFHPLQPNVICGWIIGEEAQKMELKSDAELKAGIEKILQMFLKKWNIPAIKSMARWDTLIF